MGLSASQGRMLLLTARKSDLEFRAQQISQKRLLLSQQLEEIALEYENATSNRQMKIFLYSQTQDGVENENNTRTTNLTYSALISGALGIPSDESGIQLGDYMSKPEFASTTAYRLVDATGAIVVADVSEIPTTSTSTKTQTSKVDKNNTEQYKNGVFFPTKTVVDADGESETTKKGAYGVFGASKGDDATALRKFLQENGGIKNTLGEVNGEKILYDEATGIIRVANKESEGGYTYFDLSDGCKKLTDEQIEEKDITWDDQKTLTLVEKESQIENETVTKTTNSYLEDGEELEPGLDGKYRVTINGMERTYVVDPGLKAGVTDINASKTSPNYLQDCLRNGKYLLEQGNKSEDLGKYQWKSISWDTTANISDGYYTEDDDKAKAKYDRLQQQIQNQDKKLEIELDNIETQRSAVTTEQESVKKVIQENIEGSFNAFA